MILTFDLKSEKTMVTKVYQKHSRGRVLPDVLWFCEIHHRTYRPWTREMISTNWLNI